MGTGVFNVRSRWPVKVDIDRLNIYFKKTFLTRPTSFFQVENCHHERDREQKTVFLKYHSIEFSHESGLADQN